MYTCAPHSRSPFRQRPHLGEYDQGYGESAHQSNGRLNLVTGRFLSRQHPSIRSAPSLLPSLVDCLPACLQQQHSKGKGDSQQKRSAELQWSSRTQRRERHASSPVPASDSSPPSRPSARTRRYRNRPHHSDPTATTARGQQSHEWNERQGRGTLRHQSSNPTPKTQKNQRKRKWLCAKKTGWDVRRMRRCTPTRPWGKRWTGTNTRRHQASIPLRKPVSPSSIPKPIHHERGQQRNSSLI